MLLGFFLLIFVSERTVKSFITTWHTSTTPFNPSTVTDTSPLPPLQVVAVPDYPVAAGQTVNLFCSAFTSVIWQHLEYVTWQDVGHGKNLTLTEPKQSGLYRCKAETPSQQVSPNLTVYIIDLQPTVGDSLGKAAFALSLLALITILALLCWLGWQRFGGETLSKTDTVAKGFSGPAKGGSPENDGDVYMNCTSQAYSNLDPTNMTGDNVYSSLS